MKDDNTIIYSLITVVAVLFVMIVFYLYIKPSDNKTNIDSKVVKASYKSVNYETEIIDGCEYIKVPFNGYKNWEIGGFSLTHKGNCKNHVK